MPRDYTEEDIPVGGNGRMKDKSYGIVPEETNKEAQYGSPPLNTGSERMRPQPNFGVTPPNPTGNYGMPELPPLRPGGGVPELPSNPTGNYGMAPPSTIPQNPTGNYGAPPLSPQPRIESGGGIPALPRNLPPNMTIDQLLQMFLQPLLQRR